MNEELKPCPFCGEQPETIVQNLGGRNIKMHRCDTGCCPAYKTAVNTAIWNGRYDPQLDAQSAYIEELKEALKKQVQVTKAAMSQLSRPVNSINDASLITMVEVVGKKSESVLNQSPATSLEQVKREAEYKAVMGILDIDYCCETPTGDNAYSETQIIDYANNLKEKE